ncbi:isocitrate lyase/phosphoenolpyruvate mutase family protein [Xenorhabdus budapestensis]|uniref:Carboxyvinyl-carboxyphosphonate phosphorylmutase n=1 Tax=Xenorhabdus budapestensis TaxID=290110 RepID=A0A2D0IZA6_XENBU|nr:isocitrate lyase/phosphoenolpyruvate mutase family protein [Xenorhabdus budapestensis]PHM27303.1 carboxyvinyl-carboxyphosphonate phosphorylmutase [Xenorhabdus budapestensis]
MSINDGAERIALVRTAANKIHYSLFINARIDSWLRGENTDPEHLIFRANAYLAAGVKRVSRGSFLPNKPMVSHRQASNTLYKMAYYKIAIRKN